MSLNLPERASRDHLKKLAKERLEVLRLHNPSARLADAQLAIAREYGFPSWRAMKAELDRREAPYVAEFMRACRAGDVAALRELLQIDPALARARVANGSTGLHLAAAHPDAVRLLLEHGADPNARDAGDNATALHVAAAGGHIESVRVLLDAGAGVHGHGDLHDGGVIGWAVRPGNEAVVELLLARGARHHIFSAMALRDYGLVRQLVSEDPACLNRRRSRFESGQLPLHAAIAPPDGLGFLAGGPDHKMLQLLIELGADVESRDGSGRTPLELAILRGDAEAVRILKAAGAREPAAQPAPEDWRTAMANAASSIGRLTPMLRVRDMRATVDWYQASGFTVADRYEDGGELVFARLTLGAAEITLSPGSPEAAGVSLWFVTDRVEELYALFRARQRELADLPGSAVEIRFAEDLYTPFYGGRQFSLRDPNGVDLIFWRPESMVPGGAQADRQ
jgi:ankyrin repeat protein/uncharacterized glyoxalase superfamily protein PhnB